MTRSAISNLKSQISDALRPAARITTVTAYRSTAGALAQKPPDLLDLSANEGRALDIAPILDELRANPDIPRRYPNAAPLELQLAARLNVAPDSLIVTAGADDALYRLALAVLEPGRSAVTTTPTFEMIPRYIALAGAEKRAIPWLTGPFPVEELARSVDDTTRALFIVSPNNPTGSAITADELTAIRTAAPTALLILDLAYAEFAGEDLTGAALALPRTVITRTFSKAWGLAGLRVGYAVGEPAGIAWLRSAGNPYSVSSLSLAIAERALATLEPDMRASVTRICAERDQLAAFLAARHIETLPSQANFVLARFQTEERARAVFNKLLDSGILVRVFPDRPQLKTSLRITCPGERRDFARLTAALDTALTATGDSP